MSPTRALLVFGLAGGLLACGPAGGGDSDPTVISQQDAGPDAAMVICNEGRRRAEGVEGPLTCAGEPAFVELEDRGRPFHIFTYEASHPLADADRAFPCAETQGDIFEAPEVSTEACSTAGVSPWHSVRWRDANAACEAIGWRLCSSAELTRACGGASGSSYPYGQAFETGACNVREAFLPDGAEMASVAPTGHFGECISADGAYDMTGNLWEWTNERDDMDPDARVYQGAGWKTVAERHRDIDLVCDVTSQLGGFSAPSFARATVGFRCCREVP